MAQARPRGKFQSQLPASQLLPAEIGARRTASEGQTQLSQLHIATSGKQAACLLYGDPYHGFNSRAAEAELHAQVPEGPTIPLPSAHHLQNGPPQLSCLLLWPPCMRATVFTTNARLLQNYYLHCRL